MIEKYIVPYGKEICIDDYDADSIGNIHEEDIKDEIKKLEKQLEDFQDILFAQKKYSILVILQGMDCSGKDNVIKNVMSNLNPSGCFVTPFKPPTPEEKAHDFLWRAHNKIPGRGYIGIFDRSYYEDVLIARVHNWIDEDECKERFQHINAFERLLIYNNTIILKFFLNISREEQLKKIQQRMSMDAKKWKFDKSDLEERNHWDEYMNAYEDVFINCNIEAAPWRIIPSNHKWFRNYIILKTLVSTLDELDLAYPQVDIEFDTDDIK